MKLTAAELAERLGAALDGDGAAAITNVATLESAREDSLAWATGDAVRRAFDATRAGCVITPRDWPPAPGKTCIRVANVDLAVRDALALFAPPIEPVAPGAAPSAHVDPTATVEGVAIGPGAVVGARSVVGAGTQVYPNVYIGHDVKIGRDCVLWPGVVIREHVTIGDRVILHANTTIGADGFGYFVHDGAHQRYPHAGTVIIEDDVEIGVSAAVDRAKTGATVVGRGTKIDNLVQIGHNVQIGEHCIIVAQCGISGSCTLGKYVVLAGQVGVADHVSIGAGTQVAAKAGVFASAPPQTSWMGTPAVEIRQHHRVHLVSQRLPEMKKELNELRKRVAELESSKDD